MAPSTRVTGLRTSNTVRVLRSGQMVPPTKESIIWERNTEKELSLGLTKVPSQENSKTTILMGTEYTSGQMGEFTKGTGRTIKWKDMELSRGQMEDST